MVEKTHFIEEKAKVDDQMIGAVVGGNWKVLQFLGRGGLSAVYRVRHQTTYEMAAIKILHGHLTCNAEKTKSFDNEAKVIASLKHANIVTAKAFGISDMGQPFMVLELIEGRNLSDEIRVYGRLSAQRCIRIFSQVCEGLSYAHRHAIIHRDVKPSNVMLVETPDTTDFVKILDFGIARLLVQYGEDLHQTSMNMRSGPVSQTTQTGRLAGSPMYMSPEQCRGKKVDHRSDIYSMGCLMYEALCGHPPFMGEELLDLLAKHLKEPPPSLTITTAAQAAELQRIVFKCLNKNPDYRFQSVLDLKADLEELLLAR